MADPLTIRRVPLDALHLDPANARSHGAENLDAIRASLERFGQAEPLVVQSRTGRVIGGNGRLVAMRNLGWQEADVIELAIDDLTATSLGIALNRTGELATWDDQVLGRLLGELREAEALDGVGFANEDIDTLLAELDGQRAIESLDGEDDVPPLSDDAVSRTGDLWVLGAHRLLVGDSAKEEDLDRLLAGAAIDFVNSDPPYGVRVEPRSNNAIAAGLSSLKSAKHHQALDVARHPSKRKATHEKLRAKDRPLANDFVTVEEFDCLLAAWFGNIARVLVPGGSFFVWGGYANLANYPPQLAASGLYFSQAIVWDKMHPVLTRKDYMGSFELAFYGWREGAAHHFYGPNNATDLWHLKKVSPQKMVHLTEKPVELAERAILYSSKPGARVLDLFGGSGSTLVAAEKTGRRAYLMEIDALYADVIVQRFESFSGKTAILDGDGRSFAELRAERLGEEVAS